MSDADHSEPELDDDALAMLSAYRAEEQIPAELHDRMWSRVRADVEPSAGRWLRYGATTGMLAAAAIAALWLGGQLLRGEPRAPASQAGYERDGSRAEGTLEPRAPEQAQPREQRAPAGVPVEPPPSLPNPGDAPEGVTPDAAGTKAGLATDAAASDEPPSPRSSSGRRGTADGDRRAEPIEPAPTPGGTLAEENRLLARARAALIDDRPEQALARLDEHARRFPDGILSEERQALRAVALCEAGRDAEGDAAAEAFLREHPQAALAQRVRSTCLE
jgi:hypothetical protein